VSWHQQFFDPIILPTGRKLITLRDAALYITKLPKAEHDAPEWQAAMQALLLVAEHDGPTMFAGIPDLQRRVVKLGWEEGGGNARYRSIIRYVGPCSWRTRRQ
jgi:hypothetical protein